MTLETKNLFETEGIPGFLKVILSFIDNMVVEHWKASNEVQYCSSPHLNRSGKRLKAIVCPLGNIDFEWTLLKCRNCGVTHNLHKEFFGLLKRSKPVALFKISKLDYCFCIVYINSPTNSYRQIYVIYLV